MMFKRVKVIYNPKAGLIHNEQWLRRILDRFWKRAPFIYVFQNIEYQDHAVEIASKAERDGFDAVVAVGGDGTVNAAARGLLHSNIPLGIIPVGSGNGLARGLNIPLNLRRSCQLIIDGDIRDIDAGRIRDRYFFVVA